MGLIEELKKKRDQAVALARKVPASPVSTAIGVARKALPNTSFNNPGSVAMGVAKRVQPSKVWDQINPYDNGKTYNNPTPTGNRSVVSQWKDSQVSGIKGAPGFVRAVADPFVKLGKVGVEYNRAALAKGSGNTNAYNASRTRLDENLNGAFVLGGANRLVRNAVGSISGSRQDVLDQKLAESIAQNQITASNAMKRTRTPISLSNNYARSNQGDLSLIDYGARMRERGSSNLAGVAASAETGLDLGSLGLGSVGLGVLKPTASRLLGTGLQGGIGNLAGAYGQDPDFDIKNAGQVTKTFASGFGTGLVAGEGTRLLNNTVTKTPADTRLNDADVSELLKLKQGRGGFTDDASYVKSLQSAQKAGIDITKPEAWSQIDGVLARYNQVLEGRGDPSMFNMGQSRFKPTPLNQSGFSSPDSPLTPVNRIGKMLGAKDPLRTDTSKLATNVLQNEEIVRSVMNGGIFKMRLDNGKVIAFGDHSILGRVGNGIGDDVTDVIPVAIGRGKSGNASTGQPRLILENQNSLIQLKQALGETVEKKQTVSERLREKWGEPVAKSQSPLANDAPPEIPSYVPKGREAEYLKSEDYLKDQRFNKMASETKSGDPFDHPDMYDNPTPDMYKNLKNPPAAPVAAPKPKVATNDAPQVPGVNKESLKLYRGTNDVNASKASPDRPIYHADTPEYAGTYGKVSSKEVTGGVLNADGIHAYDRINGDLRKAIAKYLPTDEWKKLSGNEQAEIQSWVNHTLEGERLSSQFNKPMPEVVKKAFNDMGIDYIRIPGDQFKGTVGKIGHQTEIIEIPKPKPSVAIKQIDAPQGKTLYRSGDTNGDSVFLSRDKGLAESYGYSNGSKGETVKSRDTKGYELDPNAKILQATTKEELVKKLTGKDFGNTLANEKAIQNELKKQGYDGVEYSGYSNDHKVLLGRDGNFNEVQVFNKNALKDTTPVVQVGKTERIDQLKTLIYQSDTADGASRYQAELDKLVGKAPVEVPVVAQTKPKVGKTPKFERDLNTGKMKMVSEPKTPVKTEKYSIANSDISRTRSPGMNEDGFTVEDWGGKKRYVSLEDASVETRTKVRKAEAEYEAAKKANNGTALSAKQKVNDAYSDAIDDLKLQDYATTENGGRTFNSKYNDWLETKYKDRNIDSATIKDMAANPQKYRSQFEAETTPVAQVGKTDINSKMLAEAKKRGYGDKYTQEGQIANTVDELMKEMNAVRDVGIPLLDKYKAKMDGKTSIEKLMTPAELKAYKQAQQTSDNASNLLKEYFDSKKSTPTPQVGKTPKTVETPVSPPAPKASNDLNAQRVFKNKETVLETIRQDKAVTKAAVDAQRTGQEVNFVATYDQNGRSVGVKPYEPSSMSIESGFVVNQQGQVIGTHIKVDDTGISANVGGEIVNMTDVVGNPSQWGNSYEVSSTMDRNLQKNAPDDATYRKTRSFVIDNKTKNEANLKTELKAKRQELSTRVADIQSVKPKNVSDTEFKSDIFDAIEGKMDDVELGKRYSPEVVAKINDYKAQTRQVYDELLDRVNTVFRQYGQPEVPHRADYLTHINELNNKPNFAGEMFGELQNSLLGEGMTRTRGQVPGNIAGRTENFEPTRKWNKFFQQRKGGKFDKDPFKAVDTYLEPTLYNIHMTESAVRARAIEATFRAVDEIKQMDSKAFSDTLNESLEKFRGGNSPKLISGFQEYANALAGKTQRWDRQVIDSSRAGELGLKGWQGLQRIGGRATVLGNANSVLSQALGTPMALAQAGPKNYIKGIVRAVKGDKIIDQSPFITARRTNSDSIFKTKFDRTMDVGGVPLQKMELAFVENTWHGMHEKALSQGYTGRQAILEADRLTERVVAGRGIADKPEAYRSTISNGFLQYTLEVNAQNKAFWRDLDTKQKATFIVSAYLMNEAYGFVTGNEPLPDFLGATIDSVQDFRNKEDERNTKDKLIGSGRRYVGEVAEMNPFVQAGANTVLTQDQRKKVFGEDSSLGRFDGVAAPVQVVRNTASAVGNLLEGDFKGARNDALKITPFGNQARKTVTGAETISKGYAVDSSGNPTFSAPTSLAGKAQTLIFGPNSSKRAGSYYDSNQRALSKDQAEQLRDLPKEKQAGFLESIQNKRMDNRKKEKDGSSTSVLTPTLQDIKDNQEAKTENFKSQFSDDDYELLGNEDMRKEAIAKGIKTQEELDGLDRYALNKRKELGMPAGQLGAKEVPDKIDKTDDKVKSFYTDRSYVHQDDYETWQTSPPESDSAKDMIRRVNQMRPEGAPELPANNRTAELYADFKREQANSKWSKLQETEKKKELLRTVYKTQLTDDQKFVDDLGTEKLIYAIDNGQVDPNIMKSMVELDNALIKLGGTAMLSKTVRSRYGLGSAPSSGGSGSGKAKKPVGLGSFTLLPQKSSIGSVANLLKNARVSYKS